MREFGKSRKLDNGCVVAVCCLVGMQQWRVCFQYNEIGLKALHCVVCSENVKFEAWSLIQTNYV